MITTLLALIENPGLPKVGATSSVIETAFAFFFGLIGVVSVLVIVIAGVQLTISGGEPQKVAKARQTILYAIVGVIVAIFGSFIVGFILGELI
jgi:Type IV secretion system pilin